MGCPLSALSRGLWSNISSWLGPPAMKRKITDLALGRWWGRFGASGSVPGPGPSASSEASATLPSPIAQRLKKWRRVSDNSG